MTDFQKARELALRAMAQREEGSEQRWATFGETLDAALSAFSAAGWELVPMEPTEAMIQAGDDAASTLAITHDGSGKLTYERMFEAELKERRT